MHIIGDGKDTFLWLNNWQPLVPLYKRFGEGIVYNLGRSLSAKIESIISDCNGKCPRSRNKIAHQIIENTPATLQPRVHCPDEEVWIHTTSGRYSTKSAWEAIRTIRDKVTLSTH